MNNRFIRHLQYSLVLLDFLSVNLSIYISNMFLSSAARAGLWENFPVLSIVLTGAWFLVSVLSRVYDAGNILTPSSFSLKTKLNYVLFLGGSLALTPLFSEQLLSASAIVTSLVAVPAVFFINRSLYPSVFNYFKAQPDIINRAGLISYSTIRTKTRFLFPADNKFSSGISRQDTEFACNPARNNINPAFNMSKGKAKTAANLYSNLESGQQAELNKFTRNVDEQAGKLKIVHGAAPQVHPAKKMQLRDALPPVALRNEPLENLSSRLAKRAFDLVASSCVIVFLLSWMVPVIGLLIWLESRGPVFFLQPRSGKDNKTFLCMKFRSMKVNSNANQLQATKNDSRITRTGKFLRRTSLDEFPQFFNVFIGDMSIVGPRPHMLKHTHEYSQLIENFMVRQLVKPGITGWAQVNGLRGETSHIDQMKQRVNHDIWYMENWNHLLDMKIVFLTVFNTLKGEAMAY